MVSERAETERWRTALSKIETPEQLRSNLTPSGTPRPYRRHCCGSWTDEGHTDACDSVRA